MFVLKNKGTLNVPDYIEIRDSELTLIRYFKYQNIDAELLKMELSDIQAIRKKITEIEYGILTSI